MSKNRILVGPALACVVWISGSACGGAAPPVQEQSDAVAAVRSAREVGAEGSPLASYHLALADEEVAEGEGLIEEGRMDAAARVLVRAKADAELAMALQREAAARTSAVDSREHIDTQRDGMRKTESK